MILHDPFGAQEPRNVSTDGKKSKFVIFSRFRENTANAKSTKASETFT